MKNNFIDIIYELKNYYQGYESVAIVAIICIFYMLIFERKIRCKYVIPLLAIAFIIFNPFIYEKVFKKIEYWRLFWMFSSPLIISTTVIC